MQLPVLGLVLFTFGNVSVVDRNKAVFAIKPSGVPYATLKADDIVIVDFEGRVVEGDKRPSSDTKTHAVLYKYWDKIGAIVHTHSTYGTAWAQAQMDIPILGTTHADHLTVDIPCAPPMSDARVKGDYEHETGFQIMNEFERRGYSYSDDATLGFFSGARTSASEPATFLLDEFLELRTFESFPGLRRVLHDGIDGLASSQNRFVLTSRYVARTLRLLRDHSARFEVIHMPALTTEDTIDILGPTAAPGGGDNDAHDADYLARTVQALADGRPAYVGALADELAALREHGGPGGGDAISALAGLLATGGRLANQCEFSYELRLHRARGYGALKAILEILGEEEGLTLTAISQRLQRTPGSTKDYLSWLEDVDLVTSRQKRYTFTDPLLRVWVRLHCRASAPTDDDLAREVRRYALPRLPAQTDPPLPPHAEPAFAMAGGPASGIIEID